MVRSRSTPFVRDAVVATAVVVGFYALARSSGFQPFQIPRYLLVVGFDLLEATFGSTGGDYAVLFAAYLFGLGLIGAAVAHTFRRRGARKTDRSE